MFILPFVTVRFNMNIINIKNMPANAMGKIISNVTSHNEMIQIQCLDLLDNVHTVNQT